MKIYLTGRLGASWKPLLAGLHMPRRHLGSQCFGRSYQASFACQIWHSTREKCHRNLFASLSPLRCMVTTLGLWAARKPPTRRMQRPQQVHKCIQLALASYIITPPWTKLYCQTTMVVGSYLRPVMGLATVIYCITPTAASQCRLQCPDSPTMVSTVKSNINLPSSSPLPSFLMSCLLVIDFSQP